MRIVLAFRMLAGRARSRAASPQSSVETRPVQDADFADGAPPRRGAHRARRAVLPARQLRRGARRDAPRDQGRPDLLPRLQHARPVFMELREDVLARAVLRAGARARAATTPTCSTTSAGSCACAARPARAMEMLRARAGRPVYTTPEKALPERGPVRAHAWAATREAEDFLRRAVVFKPDLVGALYNLAEILFEKRQLQGRRRPTSCATCAWASRRSRALVLGVKIARAQGEKPAEDSYMQQLRRRFPDAPQTRELLQRRPASRDGLGVATTRRATRRRDRPGRSSPPSASARASSRADIAQRLHMSASQIEALEAGGLRAPAARHLPARLHAQLRPRARARPGAAGGPARRGRAARERRPRIVVPSQNIRFDPLGARLANPYVKAAGIAAAAIVLGFAAMYWWLFVRPQGAGAGGEEARGRVAQLGGPRAAASRRLGRGPGAPQAEPAEQPAGGARRCRRRPAATCRSRPLLRRPRRSPPHEPARGRRAARRAAGRGRHPPRLPRRRPGWRSPTPRARCSCRARIPAAANAEVIGKPPFTVVIGNAPEVRLTYNGRDVRPRAVHARRGRPLHPPVAKARPHEPRAAPSLAPGPHRRQAGRRRRAHPRAVDDQHRHRGCGGDRRAGRRARARGLRRSCASP